MRYLKLLLPFLLLTFSCKRQSTIIKELEILKYDTLLISDTKAIGLYQTNYWGNKLVLSVFDYISNELVCIDVNSRIATRINGSRVLDIDTPNRNLYSIHAYNKDSIFWLCEKRIILTNKNGEVLYSRPINVENKDSSDIYFYGWQGTDNSIYYDAQLNSLYLRRYRIDIDSWKKGWGLSGIEAKYDFKDSTFIPLKYYYPSIYNEHYYGDANTSIRTVTDSLNLLSFYGSSDIITYNRYTDQTKHYKAATNLFTKKMYPYPKEYKPDDIQKKIEHLTYCPLYLQLFYDPYKQFYYRISCDGVDKKNEDGTYNSFENKPIIISVFDSSFKLIAEKKLGAGYGNFGYVTKEGFYLYKNKVKTNEDTKLCFVLIGIK